MSKYDAAARDWSARAYADPEWYLAERAAAIARTGPPLTAGDTVLDLACGDGGVADFLPEGVRYLGADASEEMVAAARAHGREVVHADLNDFAPEGPVAVTTCFRAIYYARERRAFFDHVRGYTEKKFVFDLNPRQFHLDDVRADARAAGFSSFEARPFFVSQTRALPVFVARSLRVAERFPPAAAAILRLRFTYVCATW